MAHTVRNITFAYVPREDRILAAINAGFRDAWSLWLTRRLALAVIERTAQYIAVSSDLTKRTPSDLRSEAVAFERDAAIAKTAQAMSTTPADVVQATANWAELAERLTIARQAGGYRLELHGQSGDTATGLLKRPELQRLLQMLQIEVANAAWVAPAAKPQPAPAPAVADPKPARH